MVSLVVVQGQQLVLSLGSVVTTALVRGVLAPFGHGIWSAIVGGAIFAAARRRGRLTPAWSLLIAYLAVALLRAAFDSTSSIPGYVIVSLVGLVPTIWLWRRSGRAALAGDGQTVRASSPASVP